MRTDRIYQRVDGYTDFSGGWRMHGTLRANEYRYAKNIITRNGFAETRPGMKLAFPVTRAGFHQGFWFDENNDRIQDGTDFWFPFTFASFSFLDIQGVGFFRFLNDEYSRQILVSRSRVYVHDRGSITEIPTAEDLETTENIVFIQADSWLIMLRGEDRNPLRWDGSSDGFISFTDPGTTNRIPRAKYGAYMFGRLWLINSRDDIYASDIYDFDSYDYVNQLFSVGKGDGDEIVALVPFKDNFAVVFKKHSTSYLSGINEFVDTTTGDTLANHVNVRYISSNTGCIGPKAFAVHGEQISFVSYRGITNISRTTENTLQGLDVPLSEPIHRMIERVNWNSATLSCATFYSNYLLFAVPVDGKTTPNSVLVYDLLGANGSGAWVSEWTSELMKPLDFFVEEENLYFLSDDGAMRQMFIDDPWDSNDVFIDTPMYNPGTNYAIGDHVMHEVNDTKTIYVCILAHRDKYVTNTTYWTAVTDPQNLYRISTDIWTRFFEFNDEVSPKHFSRCEMLFQHQNPTVSLQYEDEDPNTLTSVFSSITYDQATYDVANTADWQTDNDNLDYENPHRQDYTFFVYDPAGFYMDADNGVKINVYESHALKFIPRLLNNRSFSVKVQNTTGAMKIRSIIALAHESQFAKRNR